MKAPNLYILIAGEPSLAKTKAIEKVQDLLRDKDFKIFFNGSDQVGAENLLHIVDDDKVWKKFKQSLFET